jgi:hypothetical protein
MFHAPVLSVLPGLSKWHYKQCYHNCTSDALQMLSVSKPVVLKSYIPFFQFTFAPKPIFTNLYASSHISVAKNFYQRVRFQPQLHKHSVHMNFCLWPPSPFNAISSVSTVWMEILKNLVWVQLWCNFRYSIKKMLKYTLLLLSRWIFFV